MSPFFNLSSGKSANKAICSYKGHFGDMENRFCLFNLLYLTCQKRFNSDCSPTCVYKFDLKTYLLPMHKGHCSYVSSH